MQLYQTPRTKSVHSLGKSDPGAPRAALATQTLPTARDRWENSSEGASLLHGANTAAAVPSAGPPGAAGWGRGVGPAHHPASAPPGDASGGGG